MSLSHITSLLFVAPLLILWSLLSTHIETETLLYNESAQIVSCPEPGTC